MQHISRIVILLALCLFLAACSDESASTSEADSGVNLKASVSADSPEARSGEVPYMGVAELDKFVAQNVGKPTLVFMWATWCPSCKQQIPELEQLQATHGDKVNIVALSLDEDKAALEKYLAKKPLNVPVYWGDKDVAREFEVSAIPMLVIFDKKGQMTFGQAGVFPHPMLGAMVEKLIQ